MTTFTEVRATNGWKLGDVININHLKVCDRIANGSMVITKDELVFAPQTIVIDVLGTLDMPTPKLERRLTFSSMFGSHHGYIFPDSGRGYNLYSHDNPVIVNIFQLPEQVTLYKGLTNV